MATVTTSRGKYIMHLTTVSGELYTIRYIPREQKHETTVIIREEIERGIEDETPIKEIRAILCTLATDISIQKGNHFDN